MLLELHAHSWYSKDKFGDIGYSSPVEMVRAARAKGLSGIAIADHNSFKAWDTLKNLKLEGFTIIPGEEITTKQGHLLALGITEFVRPNRHFLDTIDEIHDKGGIAIAPHPFDAYREGLEERAQHCDAIESFNSTNIDRFSNIRAKKFANEFLLGEIGGSNAHANFMVGRGLTEVNCEPDIDSILLAITYGKSKALGKYHPAAEYMGWYAGRLKSNPEIARELIRKKHHPLKQRALNKIMEHQGKTQFSSQFICSFLPPFSVAASVAKSAARHGSKCLI
jgi:hypothetical protein